MPKPEGKNLERSRRSPDWSRTGIAHIQLDERHYPNLHKFGSRDTVLSPVEVEPFVPALKKLLSGRIVLTDSEREALTRFYDTIRTSEQALSDQPSGPVAGLDEALQHWPQAAAAEHQQHQGASGVVETLRTTKRPETIFTSDSHAVTAQIFTAAQELGWEVGLAVGVLSFDHHLDMVDRTQQLLAPNKANVMSYLLNNLSVGSTAVLGVADSRAVHDELTGKQTAYAVRGEDLYTKAGQPDTQLFHNVIRRLMLRWKQQGITRIYPTVDLDGLRLPEQGYTATDYNPIDVTKDVMKTWSAVAESASRAANPEYLEYFKNILIQALERNKPYYGLPAAWVIQAVEMAKHEFGMQIGLVSPDGKQRIVGDVNEYVGPDVNGNTARIAKGLINGLVATAQH